MALMPLSLALLANLYIEMLFADPPTESEVFCVKLRVWTLVMVTSTPETLMFLEPLFPASSYATNWKRLVVAVTK